MFFDRELIAQTKLDYPPGTRLVLHNMNDPYAPVPSGTRGTVDYVDDAGQVHMRWDNGRTLALVPGVDSFRKLTPQELAAEAPAELVYLYKNTQNQTATKLSIDNMKLKTYLQKRGYENGGSISISVPMSKCGSNYQDMLDYCRQRGISRIVVDNLKALGSDAASATAVLRDLCTQGFTVELAESGTFYDESCFSAPDEGIEESQGGIQWQM